MNLAKLLRASIELEQLKRQNKLFRKLLHDVAEELEHHVDVDYEDGAFRPNWEARMLVDIQDTLQGVPPPWLKP